MWCMFERCALFNCLERFKKNDKGRAERRNENGLTKKQQELQDLKDKILPLKDSGLNNTKIAEILNIDRKKVSRIVNSIK